MQQPPLILIYPGHLDSEQIAKLYKHTSCKQLMTEDHLANNYISMIVSQEFNHEMVKQRLYGAFYTDNEMLHLVIAKAFAS